MEIPTLKFPEPHDIQAARRKYESGQLDPNGFAARYFGTVKRAEEQMKLGYSYQYVQEYGSREKDAAQTQAVCKKMNEAYDAIREEIDRELQDYLLHHDGRIDLWPDGAGFRDLTAKGSFDFTIGDFSFHYFHHAYEVDEMNGELIQKSGLVYQNHYRSKRPSGGKAYKTNEKEKGLREEVRKKKEMVAYTRRSCIAGAVGAALLAVVAVSVLLNLLLGVGGPVISLLQAINGFLERKIIGVNAYSVLRIVVLVLSACGIWGGAAQYFTYRDFRNDLKNAEEAYRAYMASYNAALQAEEETEARHKEERGKDIRFAEEWHRAWFTWCTGGKTPEQMRSLELGLEDQPV